MTAHSGHDGLLSRALIDRAGLEARYPAEFRPDRIAAARVAAVIVAALGLAGLSLYQLDIDWTRALKGFARLGQFLSVMLPPSFGTLSKLWIYLHALMETVAIAILGTLLAAGLALPLGFLAARNVVPQPLVHFCLRRALDTVRSVNMLVWGLIWISVVGLGPFAGVLAIMTADLALFAKLFSEAIEASDQKAAEGVISTGGGALHRLRFGLVPGILPVMVGQVLYQIESNTRGATIIGIVGAGGIGAHFQEQIRLNEWQQVAFLTLILLATVAAMDVVSSNIRFAIIGPRAGGREA